jgi:magnesium transporter
MELFLPPMVRFHELPANIATARLNYAPAMSFHQQVTAQQAIDALRQLQPDVEDIYYLFVTDSQERLVGVVTIHQLICASPGARLFEFMDRRQITLPADATLEEQAQLMSESGMLALPVVDEKSRLVGAMDVSDIIRAIERESTTEMYHLAGLDRDENAGQLTAATTWYRTFWLICSLLVALLAGWVISSFQSVFASALVLVAFIPLVIRPGGQAGMQTLTFIVRSLTLGQLNRVKIGDVLNRELGSGIINGLIVGGLAGLAGWLWQGQPLLGLVVGVAVLGNLVLAALIGVGVPMACKALHIEPARASAMLVTMVTDVCGLVLFLGLASAALHMGYL